MPTTPFVRLLYPPSDPRKSEGGDDCKAHKRAASRAGFWPWQPFDDFYNEPFSEKAVKAIQRKAGLQPTGFWGRPTQKFLSNLKAVDHPGEFAYDATAVALLNAELKRRSKPQGQVKAEELLAYCKLFDDGYCWGGEHDGTTIGDSPHSCYDCSSSVSSALSHVGLLGDTEAHVSGWFERWGVKGPGKYVTVWAAGDHVWIEFTIPGKPWQRFDTSPHACGTTGPRVRTCMRDTRRFVARHPSGL